MSHYSSLEMPAFRPWPSRPGDGFCDPILESLSAGEVEMVTNGMLVSGSRGDHATGVAVDPGDLKPGNLYFALPRPGSEGQVCIAEALQMGAAGAVVDRSQRVAPGFPRERLLLRVRNTHEALRDLAIAVRSRWRGSLVTVAGALGKTLTREFIRQVLASEHSVYCPPCPHESPCGLPLSLFGLSPADHIAIFEADSRRPGGIGELCRITRPAVAVVTNMAGGHGPSGQLGSAMAALARSIEPGGTLIYSADDPASRDIGRGHAGRRISIGFSPDADIRAAGLDPAGLQETRFELTVAGITRRAMIPLAGGHMVMNALAAVAAGRHYRLGMDQIVESLRHLRGMRMRGHALRFLDGFTLIDDTYDSNPEALHRMIETIAAIRPYSRRILVAGEMLALGDESPALHHACGVHAARSGLDVVVGIQGAAQELVRGAVEAGVPRACAHFFTEVNPAINFLSRKVRSGDLVLVKGARALRLERIIHTLRAEYAEQIA